jgi:hypothetical protein
MVKICPTCDGATGHQPERRDCSTTKEGGRGEYGGPNPGRGGRTRARLRPVPRAPTCISSILRGIRAGNSNCSMDNVYRYAHTQMRKNNYDLWSPRRYFVFSAIVTSAGRGVGRRGCRCGLALFPFIHACSGRRNVMGLQQSTIVNLTPSFKQSCYPFKYVLSISGVYSPRLVMVYTLSPCKISHRTKVGFCRVRCHKGNVVV